MSNDNPFSEAAFRTLKYAPVFTKAFGSLADARAFCEAFGYYNHERVRHEAPFIGSSQIRWGAWLAGVSVMSMQQGSRPPRSVATQAPDRSTDGAGDEMVVPQ